MITFKEFLLEGANKASVLPKNVAKAWDQKDLTLNEMIELVNEHCRESLRAINNEHALLFRGFRNRPGNGSSPVLLDSSNALRASRDSNNIYQLMMDRSKHFEGIPSRSKSFICSTDRCSAKGHGSGDIYVLIPFNDTVIAYVDKSNDMFNSSIGNIPFCTRISGENVEEMSGSFRLVFESLGITPDTSYKYMNADLINASLAKLPNELIALAFVRYDVDGVVTPEIYEEDLEYMFARKDVIRMPDSTANSLAKALSGMQKPDNLKITRDALKKYTVNPKFEKTLSIINSFNKDAMFDSMASLIVKPATLKVKTISAGKKIGQDVECWFSGKCVAIPFNTFGLMLAKMKENGTSGKISKSVKTVFGDKLN